MHPIKSNITNTKIREKIISETQNSCLSGFNESYHYGR